MTVVSSHADRVASRVVAIDIRKLLLSILVFPFLLAGLIARWVVRAVVWTCAWMWFSIVEGWQMAAPRDAKT